MQKNFEEELKKIEKAPRTFLEIMKVHNNEVAIENLLAYFFRPMEKHGLKDTFIKALLNTNCKLLGENGEKRGSINKCWLDSGGNKLSCESNEETWLLADVKTEVSTRKSESEKKKKIDIWIESSTAIICIEFKIHHDLNNPLSVYQEHTLKKAKEKDKKCLFVVLTPMGKDQIGDAIEESDFHQVILSKFINEVEKLLPNNDFTSNTLVDQLIQMVKNRKIKMDLKKKIKVALSSTQLTIESVQLPNDPYWAEIIQKMKLEEISNLPGWNYRSNSRGGFVELKTGSEATKIRIENGKYRIEKWAGDKLQKETIILTEVNTPFQDLIAAL